MGESSILRFGHLLERHNTDSGPVHTVRSTAGNVNEVVKANRRLLYGPESDVFADAGHQGTMKRPDAKPTMLAYPRCAGKRRALDKANVIDALVARIEKLKVGVRAKAGHPLRVIKHQFGHVKVRYRGLKKNTTQCHLVRVVEPVEGTGQIAGGTGMSPLATQR